jgi:ATP-dependent RNA helicase DDX10/DBP4
MLQKNAGKNDSRQAQKLAVESESDSEPEPEKKVKTKVDKLFEKKNNTILSSHYQKLVEKSDLEESDDDLLTLNRRNHEIDESIPLAKRPEKKIPKKELVRRAPRGSKIVFDEEGDVHLLTKGRNPYALEEYEKFKEQDLNKLGQEYAETNKEELLIVDQQDKETEKQKRRLKKQEKKHKEKELRRLEVDLLTQSSGVQVTLRTPEDSDSESESDHSETQEPATKKHKILDDLAQDSLEDLALQLIN